jgi:pyruvate dehydrogenase E1 component
MSDNINIYPQDIDPTETQEWIAALDSVLRFSGSERAQFLVSQLLHKISQPGHGLNTPYVNTVPATQQSALPLEQEAQMQRLTAILRWNAIAMVLKAGKSHPDLGGHLATYAAAATLYEVGFNYFFRGRTEQFPGDLVYFQGHAAPGFYARAYLEGRISKEQLINFRQEVGGNGLSSYPHSWLMPNFWQFAVVSMGLGAIQGIYQAQFLKYLHNRSLANTADRKVWVFCGDGEMDEPESLGAITLAGRERLDNLIFVVNCNLQRLDGPVRGNGKIIQELESVFVGAGWNVIKVIWGSAWDELLADDVSGLLRQRMVECVDGEFQNYCVKDGAYFRKNFFGKYPELEAMVADWSDEELTKLAISDGGHDPQKVFAAYAAAVQHKDQPTLILAKTIKGYGLRTAHGLNVAHQQKKAGKDDLQHFRDFFQIPITDEQIEQLDFLKPSANAPEMQYLQQRRQALGGYLPARISKSDKLEIPPLSAFAHQLESTGDRDISTTMVFVRLLTTLLKDKNLGKLVIPIVPDESRTFGMEGLFRQIGIYSPDGQLYEPVDKAQVMYYREAKDGQYLEQGITEAGSMSSWIAAATSYSNNGLPLIPFYIFYSMFGFQRIADLAWAAADMRCRGFLLGATAGRTTLAGEGLQHDDGHSHLFSSVIPNCISYDPTFSYELAVIIHEGLQRMYVKQEDVFYYITVMNENYLHPAMPAGVEAGIIKGMYVFKQTAPQAKLRVQLMGSGAILREVIAAADLLEKDYGIGADIWSITSFTELRRDGLNVERYNRLHPDQKPKISYVTECLKDRSGPVVAATDYIKLFADQIRPYVPQHYHVLGTDGFGRSDGRVNLRYFFEVNAQYVAFTALRALVDEGKLPAATAKEAMQKYNIDSKKPDPVTV